MIQFFIVFHKYIFDECYKHISKEYLDAYFTFIAVNKSIEKIYTIINEWELDNYKPEFQERGYNENSAIYHVYSNNLHAPYTYIGFFQYDMEFNMNSFESILNHTYSDIPIYLHLCLQDYNFCTYATWKEPHTANFIINDYEAFFHVHFSRNNKYPLLNTYVIPVSMFNKIMPWIVQLYDKLYPWCISPPNQTHFGHIGGIYERIMAFAIGQEQIHSLELNINHDYKYKKISY